MSKVLKIKTTTKVKGNVTHLMIPDTQCKPNIDMSYLSWVGQYIVEKRPEVIVHIGDHADMPSWIVTGKHQVSYIPFNFRSGLNL